MRKPQILPLVTLPDTSLHVECAAVTKKELPELLEFAERMTEAMHHYRGIGIAANQVGRSIKLAVVHTDPRPLILINPELLWISDTEVQDEEGCLSVPGVYHPVWRAEKIRITTWDASGRAKKISASGLFARVIQHEIDHLHGKLITDRFKEQKETS